KTLEARIELARRERDTLEESSEARRGELAQLAEQLQVAENEHRTARAELEQLESGLAQEKAAIEAAEREAQAAQETLRALEAERSQRNAAHVEVLTSVARLEDRVAHLRDRQGAIDLRLRGVDADVEAQQTQASEAGREQSSLEEGLRNLLATRDQCQEQLRAAMRHHEAAKLAHRAAVEADQAAARAAQVTRARYDSLREVVEGRQDIGGGARHLLAAGEELVAGLGVRGLVREL